MTQVNIVEATLFHVHELGRTMNPEDRAEADNLGVKGHRALWRGWKNSHYRYAAIVDGEVAAMWGVSGSFMGGIGYPWFVTARKAREVSPHKFSSIYRSEVRKMLELYPLLVNYVDDSYIGAKKMLKISGFKLDEPVVLGKMNRFFRRFYMERQMGFDPATLAIASIAGSSAMGAAGSIEQGNAQAAAAGYNSKIATQNAQWSGAEGEVNAENAGLKTQQEEGKLKTAQAANNVDVNSGSAATTQRSVAETGMLNEMSIRSNAAREAYGYQAQSALDTAEAKQAKRAGEIGAVSSLIGGASKAAMFSGATSSSDSGDIYGNWVGNKSLGSSDAGNDILIGDN